MINGQELLAAEPAPLLFNLKQALLSGHLLARPHPPPPPPGDLMESSLGLMRLSCPTSWGLTLWVKEVDSLPKQEAWENEPQINLFS